MNDQKKARVQVPPTSYFHLFRVIGEGGHMKEKTGADKELDRPRGELYRGEAVSSPKVYLNIYVFVCVLWMLNH